MKAKTPRAKSKPNPTPRRPLKYQSAVKWIPFLFTILLLDGSFFCLSLGRFIFRIIRDKFKTTGRTSVVLPKELIQWISIPIQAKERYKIYDRRAHKLGVCG